MNRQTSHHDEKSDKKTERIPDCYILKILHQKPAAESRGQISANARSADQSFSPSLAFTKLATFTASSAYSTMPEAESKI